MKFKSRSARFNPLTWLNHLIRNIVQRVIAWRYR